MGKANVNRSIKQRHNPLLSELAAQHGNLRTKSKGDGSKEQYGEEGEDYIDAQSSRKILQLAREQQHEIAEEENTGSKEPVNRFRANDYGLHSDSEDEEVTGQNISDFDIEEEEEEFEEVVEIDQEDAAMFDQYFKKSSDFNPMNGTYILADKIMAAIKEKEQELMVDKQAKEERLAPAEGVALPEKVIRAYTTVGMILKSWTHGKLPKLFKIIPSLKNWEDVIYVTKPDEWSPHVVYEATKLFVSNFSSKGAQRFINMILLERFRENIETSEDHSLNYHIYRALKKSLYKPAAFFKGFLFPLVETGCNIREATIAGSVLTKVSVPALHSSAALSYLLRLPFSPATTVFIKILLEKKYALPYQTVDECVFYFMRFRILDDNSNSEDSTRELPLIWHKAFLSFAQRYKNDITEDQRDFLLETVRQRGHRDIGPEIRRELLAGQTREFSNQNDKKEDLMIDVQ
ncbi:HER038Cp [Eremothecium sinecaudum]|uniref:HER038Cp n=1 Tax=Eremothecium sinecaudum TaxID=45286 RepID=A0A120K2F1_9SACH|nr:HER038Cp [Eremothecium sinecaudum]AMD21317.1 HER038Cp [Eremothecium sinecaudum]